MITLVYAARTYRLNHCVSTLGPPIAVLLSILLVLQADNINTFLCSTFPIGLFITNVKAEGQFNVQYTVILHTSVAAGDLCTYRVSHNIYSSWTDHLFAYVCTKL